MKYLCYVVTTACAFMVYDGLNYRVSAGGHPISFLVDAIIIYGTIALAAVGVSSLVYATCHSFDKKYLKHIKTFWYVVAVGLASYAAIIHFNEIDCFRREAYEFMNLVGLMAVATAITTWYQKK